MNDKENELVKLTNANSKFGNLGGPGPGRPAGVPNKATQQAREAIGLFVEGNVHRLQEWLDMIAHGYKVMDDKGHERITNPNPTKAYELFMTVIEYHIAKLNRSEITGKDGEKLEPTVYNITIEGVAKK